MNEKVNQVKYTLYKKPISLDTLNIVQYLHFVGIRLLPNTIVERNYPPHIRILPAITDDRGNTYLGLSECITFYESQSQLEDILNSSIAFKELYPKYRINP